MDCKRCDKNFGTHYDIDIFIQNGWELNLCEKHKNFKPNKFIVWIHRQYMLYYRFPRHYMRIHKVGYREGRRMYFRFKYQQKKRLNW